MANNKMARLRHQVIDDCFHIGPKLEWTLEDLLFRICNELNLRDEELSLRTLQYDLEFMKSEEGYKAPIAKRRDGYKHLFFYSDASFSIKRAPLSSRDKSALAQAVALLQQFEGLPHFGLLTDSLLRIHSWSGDEGPTDLILFEENEYAGRSWIAPIYDAIRAQQPVALQYHPFRGEPLARRMHPYFLKEFRNRWYVFGYDEALGKISSAALDRIKEVTRLQFSAFRECDAGFSPKSFFKDSIGVTVYDDAAVERICFKIHEDSADYLMTKKLHPSQVLLRKEGEWSVFELSVKVNYELKAELYRFGAAAEVLAPSWLREEFRATFEGLAARYLLGD